jgi:methylated-DNA-[protein]-cysteine S-methyltransferase
MQKMLFQTAAGPVQLAWTEHGISAIELPQITDRAARAAIAKAGRVEMPPFVREARAAIERHLAGEPQDLTRIPLDLSRASEFHRKVYEVVRAVPPGATATYGEIAARLGKRGAARAVGQALGRNPLLLAVPCHRVLAGGGKPGGFSAPGGTALKARLLELEGVARGSLFTSRDPAALPFDAEEAVRHLRERDARLARMMDQVGPFRLRLATMQTPFEALAESIVYQQLTGRAAATILSRLVALFRPRRFPRPADVTAAPEELLRGAGLSRGKIAALKDLAAKTETGVVPRLAELREMAEEEIVERLTAVRGIGRWTVEMLLIFRLGRPDVLPATDYGVRKGFARTFGRRELPAPKALLAHGERWRPFRTVASWYLWRVLELPVG